MNKWLTNLPGGMECWYIIANLPPYFSTSYDGCVKNTGSPVTHSSYYYNEIESHYLGILS